MARGVRKHVIVPIAIISKAAFPSKIQQVILHAVSFTILVFMVIILKNIAIIDISGTTFQYMLYSIHCSQHYC